MSHELVEDVETLRNIMVARATNEPADEAAYSSLRRRLISEPSIGAKLPRFVRTCQSLPQFWAFIRQKFEHYRERRRFIWEEFSPLLDELEGLSGAPSDQRVSGALAGFDADHVHEVWQKALERRSTDPDGAVTVARSLLETVCKHILDSAGVAYDENSRLPELYRLTVEELNLAPAQHSEKVVRQVLGGATATVEGIGALRNRLGDAHGKGQNSVAASSRLAELAVNLAGAVALFLVESWEEERRSRIAF